MEVNGAPESRRWPRSQRLGNEPGHSQLSEKQSGKNTRNCLACGKEGVRADCTDEGDCRYTRAVSPIPADG